MKSLKKEGLKSYIRSSYTLSCCEVEEEEEEEEEEEAVEDVDEKLRVDEGRSKAAKRVVDLDS